MDPPVKAGTLLVQQTAGLRLGAKRWKKSWCALFPASAHGVARLELFDCKEGSLGMGADPRTATKRPEKKTVRLAECVSVAPAPECSPKEGMTAFRLETSQRVYLLAAEAQEAAGWVARLCEIAFPQQNPGQGSQLAANQAGEPPWEMATNSIYYSQDEVSEFWVTAQKTEAAERCGLHGRYLLKAPRDGLLLVDPCSGQTLYSWPYRLLRRYGRDKVMFSFEAGRRCESGPGNFTFETAQGNEIFRLVEAAIQSQKAQAEENRRSAASTDSVEGPSALGHLHSALTTSLSLDGEGQRREGGLPRSALMGNTSSVSVAPEKGNEGSRTTPKGQALRDSAARCPLPRLPGPPLTPPQEEPSIASVYSEPLDVVRGSLSGPDPLYADPVDSRVQPPSPEGRFYEQVGHIYDEPEGRGPQPLPAPSATTAIYDEARLPSEAWRTQGLESPAGYELPYLPGTGEYAVPAFQQKGRLPKAPKPCPMAKPPRGHRSPSQPGGPQKESNHNNNSNNSGGNQPSEPVYSQVRKPLRGARPPGQEEQSVDKSRPASAVYEDLGEI
ncbi:docking protein 1 [Anolis sagrei]|uniref:docking protein 1 n=1 Tax=Anolis sagrei TaxID=38937 RepID=UPI0035203257